MRVIGLDIKNSSLTAVQLKAKKNSFTIANRSRVELEPGIIDEDSLLLNPDAFKRAVQQLLKEGQNGPMSAEEVIVSIPEAKTFSHYLKVPLEEAGDHEAILERAKELIPIELAEATVDYRSFARDSRAKTIVFDFVAAQKSVLQPLVESLRDLSLRVVAIDVDKDSLLRLAEFYQPKKNIMLIEIGGDHTLLSARGKCSEDRTLSLPWGSGKLAVSVPSKETAEESKKTTRKTDSPKSQAAVNEFAAALAQKANQLAQSMKNQGCPVSEMIFLVQSEGEIAGLADEVKKCFPKASLVDHFDELGDKDHQAFYLNAAGLALRGMLPLVYGNDINLLPENEKETLRVSHIKPLARYGLLTLFLAMAGLTVFLGWITAKTYFSYLISDKELAISRERSQNPYLTQAVQSATQKSQLENQIDAILKDNLPANDIIPVLNSYNLNGIELVNAAYQLTTGGTMNIRLRVKTASREATKAFLEKLDEEDWFSEVISPLSNLTGKGERLIQIDLTLNKNHPTASAEIPAPGLPVSDF